MHALDFAVELASSLGAEIVVCHVLDLSRAAAMSAGAAQLVEESMRASAHRRKGDRRPRRRPCRREGSGQRARARRRSRRTDRAACSGTAGKLHRARQSRALGLGAPAHGKRRRRRRTRGIRARNGRALRARGRLKYREPRERRPSGSSGNALLRLAHFVADAINGYDVFGLAGIGFDLLAQVVDMTVERAFVDLAIVAEPV